MIDERDTMRPADDQAAMTAIGGGLGAPVLAHVRTGALVVCPFLLALGAWAGLQVHTQILPKYYLVKQDMPVAVLAVALMLAIRFLLPRPRSAERVPDWLARPGVIAGLAVLVVAAAWLGNRLVFLQYTLSRDEQMALFDASLFASGHFSAPLAPQWRDLIDMLNSSFLSSAFLNSALLSDYRPFNAIFHVPFVWLGQPALAAGFMAAAGLLLTFAVARKLWSAETGEASGREPTAVAVLLLVSSTQFLATAMTPYAMSALLACNMLWLLLYLRDDRLGHAGAIAVAFVTTGLHQIPYHPLFAGPFLFLLLLDRRWTLAAVYALAYAAIIAVWAYYPLMFVTPAPPMPSQAAAAVEPGTGFRVIDYFWIALRLRMSAMTWQGAAITVVNWLRFFVWQNLLLMPLLFVGVRAAWAARDRLMLAFVAAILATAAVKIIIDPTQGYGLGYRYQHGMLGLMCLLAAYGWMALRRSGAIFWRDLALATAATTLVATPWLLHRVNRHVAAFASVDRAIAAVPADMVIVDAMAAPYAQDLVTPDAGMRRRPVRLLAEKIDRRGAARLCAMPGTIGLFPGTRLAPIAALYDWKPGVSAEYPRAIAAVRAVCPEKLR